MLLGEELCWLCAKHLLEVGLNTLAVVSSDQKTFSYKIVSEYIFLHNLNVLEYSYFVRNSHPNTQPGLVENM